jgi:hypothetical protein
LKRYHFTTRQACQSHTGSNIIREQVQGKEKKCRGYQSIKRKKPSEKLWDAKYERYKTHQSGDAYEANECQGDFVGWLAVDIHRKS